MGILKVPADSGPLSKNGLDEGDGFKYILVMMDNLSNFVWLEPRIVHGSVDCQTLGVPKVRVSDTALHFKNRVMKTLEGAL